MTMYNKGEHPLLPYLNTPGIICHCDPRAGRMRWQNMINNERNVELKMWLKDFITIITRGKGEEGRIFIGPKDFDSYLGWMFPLSTCTEEELKKEFDRTYPKGNLPNLEKVVEDSYSPPPNFVDFAALKAPAIEGLRKAGLLPKEEKEEKRLDPFSGDFDPRDDR